MSPMEIRAHRVAERIELTRAKCAARRGERWEHHYDPHAATELGNLIYAAMKPCNKPELSQRQGADSPGKAFTAPSTECLSPAKADTPCLPSDVPQPTVQSAPATYRDAPLPYTVKGEQPELTEGQRAILDAIPKQ